MKVNWSIVIVLLVKITYSHHFFSFDKNQFFAAPNAIIWTSYIMQLLSNKRHDNTAVETVEIGKSTDTQIIYIWHETSDNKTYLVS